MFILQQYRQPVHGGMMGEVAGVAVSLDQKCSISPSPVYQFKIGIKHTAAPVLYSHFKQSIW
jgi:hypothetical protein